MPYLQKNTKLFKRIKLLQRLTTEVKGRQEYSDVFIHPFKNLDGNETVVEAGNKLGRNKLLGMIEGYLITMKYCIFYLVSKVMDKKYQNSPFEIQDKLFQLQTRLKNFEKYFTDKKTLGN